MSELLQQRVTASAVNRPDATAIVCGDDRLTYAELELRSSKLANALLASGCVAGDRVCLTVPKTTHAIVAIVGVLKAGCIYTPIDVSSPPARIARIIDSCEPAAVLVTTRHIELLRSVLELSHASPRSVFIMDGAASGDWQSTKLAGEGEIESMPVEPIDVRVSEHDPAYILFTSGSTGIPKGVPVSHANVSAFVDWANGYFEVDSSDRLSGHTALHFDLSVYDLFGALFAGAELHLVPPDVSMLPNKTAEFIREHRLTQWFSVPSVLNYMFKFDVVKQNDFPDLKRVLWCGEVLPTPTLIHWMERLPHVKFTNLYGPTEATIASSYFTVPSVPSSPTAQVPIGRACGGESLAILDETLKPVEPGETGDLFIGGAGLSSGYWRDDEKTMTVFIDAPIETGLGRIYKTGDLAYEGEDGQIYFVGRSDTQIKSRGYRIELGEIESALNSLDDLVESAVVAIDSEGFEGTLICCAYSVRSDAHVESSGIRDRLRKLIPDYMLPARWAQYESLPKNTSGKIDRVALKERFATPGTTAAAQTSADHETSATRVGHE